MTFKEIFHHNDLFHRIKLDKSEKDTSNLQAVEKIEDVKYSVNEWNQEYELIYAAYILER